MANNNVRRPNVSATSRQVENAQRQQALSYLANQRASFAINILATLVKDKEVDLANYESFVDLSVKMADKLMDKLYAVEKWCQASLKESFVSTTSRSQVEANYARGVERPSLSAKSIGMTLTSPGTSSVYLK